MTAFTPPSPYFYGITYDKAFFNQTSSGLTQAQANATYLKKSSADTATAIETFSAGIGTTSIIADRGTFTSTDLRSWNSYSFSINTSLVGGAYQVIGYGITPTVGSISFYPQANTPIILYSGFYNIQATFQFNLSAINGTSGRIAVGVTSNSASGDWDYATNGNFNNNIYKTHLGTLANADFPLVYSINFNAAYGGYLYFKYYIQLASASGSVVVNYMITRLG